MNKSERDVQSMCLSLAISVSFAFVTRRFVLPLLWAAILCIAAWPLCVRVLRATGAIRSRRRRCRQKQKGRQDLHPAALSCRAKPLTPACRGTA
jgi:hypothetical protein